MELKDQLVSTLIDNLGGDSVDVLAENVDKYRVKETQDNIEQIHSGIGDNISFKGDVKFRLQRKYSLDESMMEFNMASDSRLNFSGLLIKAIIGILLLGGVSFLFYLGGKFIGEEFSLKLYLSILIEIGIILGILCIYLFIKHLIRLTYRSFERKFDSIKPEKVESKNEFDDDVYFIISNTYDTLSVFRQERERQARNTFNAALGLIVAGILIVFIGVYLLFRKNVTEGSVTSSVGAISNILGGTIIKFYKDTNNRMDRLNNDLFVLNTAKVQYAMILKIGDSNKRDSELSELIKSVGKIKSTGYNNV